MSNSVCKFTDTVGCEAVRATTRTGYEFSCNLIGSYAEPKHWIDRERTNLQVNNSPALQDHARGADCSKHYYENQPRAD